MVKRESAIRCYQCVHFEPHEIGGANGWCHDTKPKARSKAYNYCDLAVAKDPAPALVILQDSPIGQRIERILV